MAEESQVTTKEPKKVEAGERLAAIEYNRKKREELKAQKSKSEFLTSNQYGIGVVLAVGVIGSLGCYLYRTKKGEVPPPQRPQPSSSATP